MAQWIESRTCNPKVAGIVGGGSECPAVSPPSIPRLRWDPWARHRTPNCSPGTAALAAHCSGCVFTVCVCVHYCVCALGWVKCRAQIPSMGHHTWPHVTSLSLISHIQFSIHYTIIWCLIPERLSVKMTNNTGALTCSFSLHEHLERSGHLSNHLFFLASLPPFFSLIPLPLPFSLFAPFPVPLLPLSFPFFLPLFSLPFPLLSFSFPFPLSSSPPSPALFPSLSPLPLLVFHALFQPLFPVLLSLLSLSLLLSFSFPLSFLLSLTGTVISSVISSIIPSIISSLFTIKVLTAVLLADRRRHSLFCWTKTNQ